MQCTQLCLLIFAAVAVTSLDAVPLNADVYEKGFSLACTIKCTSWWACYVQNIGKPQNCPASPSGCNCDEFAWRESPAVQSKSQVEERGFSLACTIKCTSWWACYVQNIGKPQNCPASPSGCNCDEFAWKEASAVKSTPVVDEKGFSLACTIKCTSWWACYVQNIGKPGNCPASPSGCNCDEFAWRK